MQPPDGPVSVKVREKAALYQRNQPGRTPGYPQPNDWYQSHSDHLKDQRRSQLAYAVLRAVPVKLLHIPSPNVALRSVSILPFCLGQHARWFEVRIVSIVPQIFYQQTPLHEIFVVDQGAAVAIFVANDCDRRVSEHSRLPPEPPLSQIEVDGRLRLNDGRGPEGVARDVQPGHVLVFSGNPEGHHAHAELAHVIGGYAAVGPIVGGDRRAHADDPPEAILFHVR
mmetsp:Transcript_27879/g.63840  ORF Transcript_27879/g.63840 Transcript_27879/m.63840 type:complete len:225 (-) Transcript_27879:743-1417(-)